MNFPIFKIFFSVLLFLACPFLINAQTSHVNINVSAVVRSTSTTPATFCGDGNCDSDERCSTCPEDCGSCGGVFISPDTKVIFQGNAYPDANIFILKDGVVIASFKADDSGIFEKSVNGLPGGTYKFSIYAEDKNGLDSETLNFTLTVLRDKVTTVSGIFIPPTISLFPSQAQSGEKISIFGQTFPDSEVDIYFLPQQSLKKTNSNHDGDWNYYLNTENLNEGTYMVRSLAVFKNGESSFSKTLSFSILKNICKGADLNFDGQVDLTDFSILLYFWGQSNPSNRCADINNDGGVNIIDFSIMMYYWTE
jgi:hypothetical protein